MTKQERAQLRWQTREMTKQMTNNSKEDVRQNILKVAEELFEHYGYEKTTIEDISSQAHKAKTAVYYYFSGKNEIFASVIAMEFQSVSSQLDIIKGKAATPDNSSALLDYFKARINFILGMPVYSKYLVRGFFSKGGAVDKILKDARSRFDHTEHDYFRKLCQFGLDTGAFSNRVKPDAFANMMGMILKGLELQMVSTQDSAEYQATYEEVLELIISGCRQ